MRQSKTADGSDMWRWGRRFGRWQLGLTVYRHTGHLPDRWVFKPNVVYDRKG